MKTVWKVLLGLALVVPLCAYVAGSLAASASDDPAQRHTIQIQQPSPKPTKTPSPTPSDSPSPEDSASPDDEVEVITPDYDDFGDDHGGDDNSGHGGGGDDSSGPGGGGDDNSGHGGGDDHSGHGGGSDD